MAVELYICEQAQLL